MGNIFSACSSKKHTDKVDDFTNISVHGKVKVDVKVEEKVVEEKVVEEKVVEEKVVEDKVVEEGVDGEVKEKVIDTTIEENKL